MLRKNVSTWSSCLRRYYCLRLFYYFFFFLWIHKKKNQVNVCQTIFWNTFCVHFRKTNTLGLDFFFNKFDRAYTCLPVIDVLLEHCMPHTRMYNKKITLSRRNDNDIRVSPLHYRRTGFPSIDFRTDTPISPSISHVLYCSSIRNKSCIPSPSAFLLFLWVISACKASDVLCTCIYFVEWHFLTTRLIRALSTECLIFKNINKFIDYYENNIKLFPILIISLLFLDYHFIIDMSLTFYCVSTMITIVAFDAWRLNLCTTTL